MHYLSTPVGDGVPEVILRVPQSLPFQLVFRQERRQPFDIGPVPGAEFVLVDSLSAAMTHRQALQYLFGVAGAAKAIAKILAGRIVYFVRDGGQILHTGWITVSRCRYYRVCDGDIVIGPIWSAETSRRRGIGAFATQMAINAMIQRGRSVFFIDTENSNLPCLRMIDKCDFGHPIASYLRR